MRRRERPLDAIARRKAVLALMRRDLQDLID
jgi:hypothetical protein